MKKYTLKNHQNSLTESHLFISIWTDVYKADSMPQEHNAKQTVLVRTPIRLHGHDRGCRNIAPQKVQR